MSERTREQIGEMVAQMENAVCAHVRLSRIPDRFWDDLKQDIRMELCKAAARFDPARGVKWSSFAIGYIRGFLRSWRASNQHEWIEHNSDDFEDFAAGRSSRFEDDDNHRHRVTDDEHEQDAPFVALSLGLKRAFAEPILAQLTPKQRELIEALVFDGFTVEQYAGQHGQPVKVVRTNLKNTLRMMAEAGLVGHVASDADAGRILNKDQSPIQRKPDCELARRVRRAASAPDLERKRAAEAEKARERAKAHAENRAAVARQQPAPNRAELALARAAASQRARQDAERRAALELAARQPAVESEWAALGDDVRVAVLGYLSREWTFEQAADLLGTNTRSLGKRLQRIKRLAAVELRLRPHAVPERNSGDPIASVGQSLTA